jgi:hypothetical protein
VRRAPTADAGYARRALTSPKGENTVKHARSDYDRIQDPDGLIPDDEPVFLIRAQDRTAPVVLQRWANLNADLAPDLAAAVRRHAELMIEWQLEHGSKVADAPADALR